MIDVIRIAKVEKREKGWRITDTKGVRYFTRNSWKASIFQIAKDQDRPVMVSAYSGWYYKQVDTVHLVEGEASHAS